MVGRRSLFFLGQGLFSGLRTLGVFRDATCFLVISSGHGRSGQTSVGCGKEDEEMNFSKHNHSLAGWCSTPTLLLICSSFSREIGHRLLIGLSLSTAQLDIPNCPAIHGEDRCFFFDPLIPAEAQGLDPSSNHTQMLHAWHIYLHGWLKCMIGIIHFGILVNLLSYQYTTR